MNTHKNIIIEKFNQKKHVIVMYEVLLGRRETKGLDTVLQILYRKLK